MNESKVPLFPVAELTVGPVPRLGIVIIRPDFLTHATQTPAEAQQGRTYALMPLQARELIRMLEGALTKLESSAPPDGGGPTH